MRQGQIGAGGWSLDGTRAKGDNEVEMSRVRDRISSAACALLLASVPCIASADGDSLLLKQLQETTAKIREMSGPTIGVSTARTRLAEHLPQITEKMDPASVDDKTLSDLTSLLDTWDQSVLSQVAAALGNLGPRARSAGPKLLEIVAGLKCYHVVAGMSWDSGIYVALHNIGIRPAPLPFCGAVGATVGSHWISGAIEQVKAPSKTQCEAAMRLVYLTAWLPAKDIDETQISHLVSLLDSQDERIREQVVIALGNLRSRARAAVPKLEGMLRRARCHDGGATLAETIRQSLVEIGVKPQVPRCGK
jgi:hypothetical protein